MTGEEGSARLNTTPDLPWSRDFFYNSIGGTLVMSRRIFWDKFLKVRLQSAYRKAVHALNIVATKLATLELATHASWWLSNSYTVGESEWTSVDGPSEIYHWHNEKFFGVEHDVVGPNHMYEYYTTSSVNHML
jgi:hypothetical protein